MNYTEDRVDELLDIRIKFLENQITEILEVFGLEFTQDIMDKVISLFGSLQVYYNLTFMKSKHQLERSYNILKEEKYK